MLLRRLFFIACVFAVVSSHAALTVTERVVTLPDPVKVPLAMDNTTVQYLYNVGTQSYFLGANEYNTRASVSQSKGYKVKVEDFGGMYAIRDSVEEGSPKGQWLKMFANDATGIWVDNDNGVNADAWVIEVAADGTFQISNPAAAEGVLGADKGDGDTRLYLYPQERENFSYTWYAVSADDYKANIEARANVIATNEALKKLWEILVDADKAGVPGLAQYEALYADETATPETLNEAVNDVKRDRLSYQLRNATAAEPTDVSWLIENRTFDIIGDFTGWSGTAFGAGGTTSTCAEHYQKTFDTYQDIENVPNGVWALNVDGFYRYSGSWDDHVKGTDGPVKLYATNIKANEEQNETYTGSIMSIYDGIKAGNNTVSSDNTQTYTHDGESYIVPVNMKGATNYFDAGYYKDNKVLFAVSDGSMRIGVAKQTEESSDWAIFDNFGLKYYGNGTDAYQLLNDDILSQAPVYNADEVFVSTPVLDTYNLAKAATTAATYDDVMKNKQTLAAARADVEANIEAWKVYKEQLDTAVNVIEKITKETEYRVDDVDVLTKYIELDAEEIIKVRPLGSIISPKEL
ncbi:MAG: hypothetical protein Q4D28_05180, partial [Prevotellaceae bacterium]|nr:hypothetical protein [Prevotellaceae bacterium]